MVKLDQIIHNIPVPDGVNANIDSNVLTVSKDGTSLSREFRHNRITTVSYTHLTLPTKA